ncbi:MAG TPA: hypothetical protein VJY33_22210 [Isosphaeraceae bacterium]|jgi:hypothetical protein|nr:hypothetical protein [Isosphaeraceae bacterium]
MARTAATGMTPREIVVWKFMLRFQAKHHGMGPSMQEIADACAIGTVSGVQKHLIKLVEKGKVLNRNRRYVALQGKDLAHAEAS